MKLEHELQGQHVDDKDEEEDEYTHFTNVRFCRSDESGHYELAGYYFPNFQILYDKKTNLSKCIAFHQPRPTSSHMRDDSLTCKTEALKERLIELAGSVGILYVLEESAQDKTISAWEACTFGVYEVRGKYIGITILRTVKSRVNPSNARFFIDPSNTRFLDKTGQISGDFDNFTSDLIEVFIHKGALSKRTEYLNSLTPSDNDYKINLDPEFGQCAEPILNVVMFEIPAVLHSWPHLKITTNKVAKDEPAFLLAYHSVTGESKNTEQEYLFTTRNPPLPEQVVWLHRSLGVGKVVAVGDGLVNVINSAAQISHGGPLLNERLEVFAIHLGGFYDDPGNPAKQPSPGAWSKIDANNPFLYDVKLPEEPTGVRAKKNRNIGLSVLHSGFVAMLQAIAS